MSYTTKAELITAFGEKELTDLTDDDHTGSIVDSVVNKAIDDASELADSWLGAGGYSVPLKTPPASLKRVVEDIARYLLWDDQTSEVATERYKEGILFLNNVSCGKQSLNLEEEDAAGDSSIAVGQTNFKPGKSTFNWDAY